MALPFTIQIPVFDETRALSFSSFYFAELGLRDVRYVLDSKRSPAAEAALRALGREPVYFENDQPFIENGYESFAAVSPTDWILRIDCDEVPNLALIEFCRDHVEQGRTSVAGFERHQVLWRDERLLTAATDRFKPANQRQWRLFDRRLVSFDTRIHTAGIHVAESAAAPPAAALFHLSWVFLTWDDRVKKAACYDDYGQPEANRTNQLFPLEHIEWQDLDAPFVCNAYRRWLQEQE